MPCRERLVRLLGQGKFPVPDILPLTQTQPYKRVTQGGEGACTAGRASSLACRGVAGLGQGLQCGPAVCSATLSLPTAWPSSASVVPAHH